MQRKMLAGLVPLLASAMFVIAPAAAQAEPHWYKGSTPIGSTPVTVATSGNLTISTLGATIVCKVNDAEEIWNPVGGGAGVDVMTAFVLTKCKNKVASPACPKGSLPVTAAGLPWPSRLYSEPAPSKVIRDEIVKVRLIVNCASSAGTVGDEFQGSLTPEVGLGALNFGPGSGTLTDPSTNPLTIGGADKMKAAGKGQITAKDP